MKQSGAANLAYVLKSVSRKSANENTDRGVFHVKQRQKWRQENVPLYATTFRLLLDINALPNAVVLLYPAVDLVNPAF